MKSKRISPTERHSVSPLTAAAVAAVLVIGWSARVTWAQEHPEHPTGEAKAESAVTLEDVATTIESYVKDESKSGAFKVEDKETGKSLALALERIHRDRLSQVGPDMFFACADFKGADGKEYDLDFFAQGTTNDNIRVLPGRTSIHKVNGKERYAWAFDVKKGLWEQKPVGTKAEKSPAMKHP